MSIKKNDTETKNTSKVESHPISYNMIASSVIAECVDSAHVYSNSKRIKESADAGDVKIGFCSPEEKLFSLKGGFCKLEAQPKIKITVSSPEKEIGNKEKRLFIATMLHALFVFSVLQSKYHKGDSIYEKEFLDRQKNMKVTSEFFEKFDGDQAKFKEITKLNILNNLDSYISKAKKQKIKSIKGIDISANIDPVSQFHLDMDMITLMAHSTINEYDLEMKTQIWVDRHVKYFECGSKSPVLAFAFEMLLHYLDLVDAIRYNEITRSEPISESLI